MTDSSKGLAQVAAQHGFSEGAARALLDAMRFSRGAMAQFDHPELGGMGQWSSGGMLMIGDMFDRELKARVGALAEALSRSLRADRGWAAEEQQPGDRAARRGETARWWPEELGSPASAGSQNGVRYAVFPDKRRLAVERNGRVSVRDTGDRAVSGVAQQQGATASLRFSGPWGSVDLDELPEA